MSPRDELDMDNIAEGELLRLQRQYRIMEGERQAYAEETNVILQKQRCLFYILNKIIAIKKCY